MPLYRAQRCCASGSRRCWPRHFGTAHTGGHTLRGGLPLSHMSSEGPSQYCNRLIRLSHDMRQDCTWDMTGRRGCRSQAASHGATGFVKRETQGMQVSTLFKPRETTPNAGRGMGGPHGRDVLKVGLKSSNKLTLCPVQPGTGQVRRQNATWPTDLSLQGIGRSEQTRLDDQIGSFDEAC